MTPRWFEKSDKGKGRDTRGQREMGPSSRDLYENFAKGNSSVEFRKRDFKRIVGNVLHPDQARIICFGDNHMSALHTQLNAQFINHVGKEGDIVLLEGVEAYESCEQQDHEKTQQLTKPMYVFGWDSSELTNQAVELNRQREQISDYLNSGNLNYYGEEYANYHRQYEDLGRQIDDINVRQRNEVLAQVIDNMKASFPEQKIFVLAGTKHFESDDNLRNMLRQDKFVAYTPTQTGEKLSTSGESAMRGMRSR